METNYGVLAAVIGICAVVGIYYCWVRKINQTDATADVAPPRTNS
jgi:hypothetical protein